MTKEEAIKKLSELFGDPECNHGEADDILLARLRAVGEYGVAQAWEDAENRIGFWYA